MVWWQWIVLAALLLGAEMVIDAEFYLVFLGLAALSMGILNVAIADIPVLVDWLLFCAIAVGGILLFRSKLYGKIRGDTPDRDEGVVGEIATAESSIAPGAVGRVSLRGTSWDAKNTGETEIPAQARARVETVSGFTVHVRMQD